MRAAGGDGGEEVAEGVPGFCGASDRGWSIGNLPPVHDQYSTVHGRAAGVVAAGRVHHERPKRVLAAEPLEKLRGLEDRGGHHGHDAPALGHVPEGLDDEALGHVHGLAVGHRHCRAVLLRRVLAPRRVHQDEIRTLGGGEAEVVVLRDRVALLAEGFGAPRVDLVRGDDRAGRERSQEVSGARRRLKHALTGTEIEGVGGGLGQGQRGRELLALAELDRARAVPEPLLRRHGARELNVNRTVRSAPFSVHRVYGGLDGVVDVVDGGGVLAQRGLRDAGRLGGEGADLARILRQRPLANLARELGGEGPETVSVLVGPGCRGGTRRWSSDAHARNRLLNDEVRAWRFGRCRSGCGWNTSGGLDPVAADRPAPAASARPLACSGRPGPNLVIRIDGSDLQPLACTVVDDDIAAEW